MQYCYQIYEQTIYSQDHGYYRTYGIQCYQKDHSSLMIAQIDDVSTDKWFAAGLAACFTEQDLDSIHFIDAVCGAIL